MLLQGIDLRSPEGRLVSGHLEPSLHRFAWKKARSRLHFRDVGRSPTVQGLGQEAALDGCKAEEWFGSLLHLPALGHIRVGP